jgi:hypothetical protein
MPAPLRPIALALLTLLAFAGCHHPVPKQFEPTAVKEFHYADWQRVLDKAVTSDGYVKYDVLRHNAGGARTALERFVEQVGQTSPENRPDLFTTDSERLAYYLNAANAQAMMAVVKKDYPKNLQEAGILTLGTFSVGGRQVSLAELEKEALRLGDTRIHFALNNMARSSPPLRQEAYNSGHLDAQLDDQGRRYLSDPRGAEIDPKKPDTARLSELFTKFYPDDFKSYYAHRTGKKDADLIDALRIFASDESPVSRVSKWEAMPFDWSLNEAR